METENSKSEIMNAMGGWAFVKKSRRPPRPKNPNHNKSVTIVNEDKLHKLFAMPEDGRSSEALICTAKMAPQTNKSRKERNGA